MKAALIKPKKSVESLSRIPAGPDDSEDQNGIESTGKRELGPAGHSSLISQDRLLLRTLIDNLPDCIYAKDAAGRKTMANPADLKNLRCKTEADAIGKNDFDLFSREIAENFWLDDQKVLQGHPVINREEYFIDEEGRKRWLLTSKLPMRDQSGTIVGLVGIGRDITDIKQAEAKLDQIHKQLLETSRQAGMAEVATSVLHNVGNVLNSVNVASACVTDILRKSKAANLSKIAALLQRARSGPGSFHDQRSQRQTVARISGATGRTSDRRTNRLLWTNWTGCKRTSSTSRTLLPCNKTMRRLPAILESLPIVDLLEDAVRMNAGSMERHDIKVLREYSETPPVLMDKHKVLQILVNIVRNAKHACNDSGKPDKQIILRVASGKGRIRNIRHG